MLFRFYSHHKFLLSHILKSFAKTRVSVTFSKIMLYVEFGTLKLLLNHLPPATSITQDSKANQFYRDHYQHHPSKGMHQKFEKGVKVKYTLYRIDCSTQREKGGGHLHPCGNNLHFDTKNRNCLKFCLQMQQCLEKFSTPSAF